jgi:hypothetical protein
VNHTHSAKGSSLFKRVLSGCLPWSFRKSTCLAVLLISLVSDVLPGVGLLTVFVRIF